MTAKTDTYDGTHFQVVLMNMKDGSVQGHAAGCADLTRGKNFAGDQDPQDVWDVLSKEQAREGYNADFDEETDGWYDIDWKPCAKHVPATHETEALESTTGTFDVVETVPTLTAKVGRKWTYLYAGDVLVAEVLNTQAAAVAAYLS
jgi:hypothetical protein